MGKKYSKEEIIKKLEESKSEMGQFYSENFLNYIGETSNEEGDYTEIIARWLLDNIELFDDIEMISRKSNYKVKTHDGVIKNEGSKREEEKILRILELKKPDSEETMLRCVLEAYTYLKVVDKAKLLKDFGLPKNTKIKACPFVFYGKEQHKEMQQDRKHLKDLIKELGIEIIYLREENEEYSVIEE